MFGKRKDKHPKREVIPGGWVKLIGSMGSDLDVVNSARISFNKTHEYLENGDPKLIHYLMKNRHGTPFEAIELHFQIRCPIFVTREWHRHRLASYNEISGRYTELEMDAYYPERDAIRKQVGKPGHYTYETVCDPVTEGQVFDCLAKAYKTAFESYQEMLRMGIAKELARVVLPVGLFTEFRYKTNARSFMNFLSLRNAPNAMYEIRKYAEAMEDDFAIIAPHTWEAFIKNGRTAP